MACGRWPPRGSSQRKRSLPGPVLVGLEVDLVAHAAVGAGPLVGDVAPRRPGRETLARVPRRLVVDVTAGGAAPAAHEAAPWRARMRPRLRGWMLARVTSPSKCSTRRWSITRRQSGGNQASTIIPA